MIASRHSLDDARVVHKEAVSLSKAGHDVILLFSCNDHFDYTSNDGSVMAKGITPNGETMYKGLRVLGRPKRQGLWGKWKTFLELSYLAFTLKADVYHAHEPDLALAIAIRAKRLSKLNGHKALVVHDMHEYPPGEQVDKVKNILKAPILLGHILWDKFTMNWVDHVFTANSIVRGYALVLSHRMNVDVLYNGPIMKLFQQSLPKTWNDKERLVLCHEGSLPFDRGLKEMIEAIDRLRDRVRLLIIGDLFGEEKEWLEREVTGRGLMDTITMTGWIPYEKVGKALNDCHVGLILFRECMENRMAGPPNKLFNYMNAGLPVLSVDFPEMRQIIFEEHCGILIQNQSVGAIVDGIKVLLSNSENLKQMGENGQRAIRERYSWECMENKFLFSYEKLSMMLGK
jgi:glycosyltransferase involved in cell wall biosynthesis